jgi:predicted MFS family arabinose efflux permease
LLRLIILITFIESFVTATVERGVAFYVEYELGFSQSQTLWLALLFGAAYVAGALLSHRAADKLGERRWLVILIAAHIVFHLGLAMDPNLYAVFILNTLLGASSGSKWPIVESYVSAGQTPRQAAASVGQFNIAWSFSVVPAVALGGILIETWSPSLFLLPAILNLGVIALIMKLPARPVHLPTDHPLQPTDEQKIRIRSLLFSSRWLMFGSYTLLFLLAPLLPYIFKDRLHLSPGPATALVSLIDLARFATFVVLQRSVRWHGRISLLLWTAALMPAGFLLILTSDRLPLVLLGELIFGIAGGLTYYAALYYAMVMKNAAVEAAGAHEGLIGSGFIVGPAMGLTAIYLSSATTTNSTAMIATTLPFLIFCTAAGLWSLRGARKTNHFQFPD